PGPAPDRGRQPRGLQAGLAAAGALRARAQREDRNRELPNALLERRMARRTQPRLLAGVMAAAVRDRARRQLWAQPRPVAPGVAVHRLHTRSPRIRASDLPRAREGHGGRPRWPL